MKKYQFLVQNRDKILKFGFFDNFSHIGRSIPWIFSVFLASTTILKIQKFFTLKLPLENRDNFFAVRYPVDKSSCRRFLKSPQKSHDFRIFFCFPFEVCDSAIFHRTCRKCMYSNSSGLTISQSVRNFYKKTEKNRRKPTSTAICPFIDFCRWHCELQPSVKDIYKFRSPFLYRTAETRILKKFVLVIEI